MADQAMQSSFNTREVSAFLKQSERGNIAHYNQPS